MGTIQKSVSDLNEEIINGLNEYLNQGGKADEEEAYQALQSHFDPEDWSQLKNVTTQFLALLELRRRINKSRK